MTLCGGGETVSRWATGSTGRGRRTGDTAASWAGLWCAWWMQSNREPERDSSCCGSQKDWFPTAAAWIVGKKKRKRWERGEPTKPGHLAEFTDALWLQENALFLLVSLGEQRACWEQVTRKEVFQQLSNAKRGFVLGEWRWSVFVFLKDITYLFVSGGSGYFSGGRALWTALISEVLKKKQTLFSQHTLILLVQEQNRHPSRVMLKQMLF